MDLQNYFLFFAILLNLSLFYVIVKKSEKSELNISFLMFIFFVVVWTLGIAMFRCGYDKNFLLFWNRIFIISSGFIASSFFHFSILYSYENKKLSNLKRFFLYFPNIFIIIGVFIPNILIKNIEIRSWGNESIIGYGYIFFGLYFSILSLLSFFLLVKKYKKEKGIKKMQTLYVVIGLIISLVFGAIFNLIFILLGNYKYIWLGPYASFIMVLFIGYSIITQNLMDIRLILRKYFVFILSILSILLPALLARYFVKKYFVDFYFIFEFLIIIFFVIAFPKIKIFFYDIANKYFFSSLYDSRIVISKISDKLRSTLILKDIYKIIYKILSDAFHFEFFAIAGYEKETKKYKILYNVGYERNKIFTIFNDQTVIEKIIKQENQVQGNTLKFNDSKIDKQSKEKIKMSLFLPLYFENKFIGIIIFGPKMSRDMYNQDDIDLLKIISSQAAISLENARLFEETNQQRELLSVQGRQLKDLNDNLQDKVDEQTKHIRAKNEYLQKLLVMRSEFLDIASHQLRTPVSVIKGTLSMIVNDEIRDEAKKKVFIENCFKKSIKLSDIIHDILKASEMDTDKTFDLKMSPLNPLELLKSLVKEKKPDIESKSLKLKLDFPKRSPNVWGEELYLRQALLNLINNSIQYTNQGNISLSLKKEGKYMIIRVSDTGIGISKEDKAKLFQKFSRGKNAVNAYADGSGLGLFIIRRIIEAHKGADVAIEKTKLDHGTTFLIKLLII